MHRGLQALSCLQKSVLTKILILHTYLAGEGPHESFKLKCRASCIHRQTRGAEVGGGFPMLSTIELQCFMSHHYAS